MTIKKKVTVNYVDNQKFYAEIVEHKKRSAEAKAAGKEPPRLNNYIGDCIYKMAKNLATKPCFMNYSYKDEMVSDAIENCILYFEDYDPNYGKNPFAYFTQVIYFAFLRRIKKEEKNRYIIYKNFQETIIHNGHTSLLTDSDDNQLLPTTMYDNINIFMKNFEEKEAIKKEKRKAAKEGLDKFYEEEVVDSPAE
jgi:hypothetical protein